VIERETERKGLRREITGYVILLGKLGVKK